MPTMAQYLGLVSDGALAGYGLDFRDEGRLAAKYVLRILGGTSPSELPVEINERHILGVNLRTARALNLTIPPTLLARADEVIEEAQLPGAFRLLQSCTRSRSLRQSPVVLQLVELQFGPVGTTAERTGFAGGIKPGGRRRVRARGERINMAVPIVPPSG